MSNVTPILFGDTDAEQVWPGHARMNDTGAQLAVNLLLDLQRNEPEDGKDGPTVADLCSLEDWPREGQPRRDLLTEYLELARAAGPDVEHSFLAVVQDALAMSAQAESISSRYFELFGWTEIDKAILPSRQARTEPQR